MKEPDREMLELALAMCWEKRAEAVSRRDAAQQEIEEWDYKIDKFEDRAKKQGISMSRSLIGEELERTPAGRVPHGHSEQLVVRYLRDRRAEGASMREMEKRTATKYSTVARIIAKLKDRGQIESNGTSRWRLVATTKPQKKKA